MIGYSRGDCDASGVTPPLPWTVAIAVSWSWTADTRLSLEGGGADGAHFLASPSPLSRHHFFHMGLRARLLQLCRLITCTCVYLTLWLLDAGAAGQRPYPLPTSPPNHRMVNQGLSGSNQFGICFRPLPFFACWTTTSSRLQAGCVNISDILRYITRAQHGSNQGRRKCFDLRFFVLQRRSLRPRSGYTIQVDLGGNIVGVGALATYSHQTFHTSGAAPKHTRKDP